MISAETKMVEGVRRRRSRDITRWGLPKIPLPGDYFYELHMKLYLVYDGRQWYHLKGLDSEGVEEWVLQ